MMGGGVEGGGRLGRRFESLYGVRSQWWVGMGETDPRLIFRLLILLIHNGFASRSCA